MPVKVGVLSDTHDILGKDVIDALSGCSYILHAGDVTSERILDRLRPLGRLYLVRGNNDYGRWAEGLHRKLKFQIEGVSFVMVHEQFRLGRDASEADIAIFGHTHTYSCARQKGLIRRTPGSGSEPRCLQPRSIAILTIDGGHVTDIRKIEFPG